MRNATHEQKLKYLPKLLTGKLISPGCLGHMQMLCSLHTPAWTFVKLALERVRRALSHKERWASMMGIVL